MINITVELLMLRYSISLSIYRNVGGSEDRTHYHLVNELQDFRI